MGNETSQDEAGTAAYKTVELDDLLGGTPVQHREVQNYESPLFLSYFQRFLIQEGGVESGFEHVKPTEYRPRLLHVKGIGKTLSVREVPKTYQSMNSGDVFILDAGLSIYQWNGKQASGIEKMKAAQFSRALDDERSGKAEVHVFEEGDSDDAFWTALGQKGPVASADQGGSDKSSVAFTKKLYRLSDATSTVVMKEEASGKVLSTQFDSKDAFIFDNGLEVFVWVGKDASPEEKRLGIQYAQNYLVKYNRPPQTPISRLVEGAETETFVTSLDDAQSNCRFKYQ